MTQTGKWETSVKLEDLPPIGGSPVLTWPGKRPLDSVTCCPSHVRESYGSASVPPICASRPFRWVRTQSRHGLLDSKTGKHHFNPAGVAGPDPGGAETEEARLPGTVWTMDAEEVKERVGRSGCKVDLAVRHPEYKDCYRIGIVCDGDSYHAPSGVRASRSPD